MRKWRLLLELLRPPFLVFTSALIFAGYITTGSFSTDILPSVIGFTFLGQLSVISINDYFDRDTDQGNTRKGSLEGAIVTKENEDFVKKVVIVSHLLLVILAFFHSSFVFISSLTVFIASFLYSVPPFRFKARPFLDSLCNVFILYFTFGIGTGLAGGGITDIIPGMFWFALIFGGPVHMAASYVDRKSDREAGLKTSAMVLGHKGIVLLVQALIVLALVFEEWSSESQNLLLISLIFSIYPLFSDRNMKKLLYSWALVCAGYSVLWISLRL